MTQAEHELLDLLVRLRATLVGVHRALRAAPGANKACERSVALMFEAANDLEREVANAVGVEVVKV